MIGFSRLKEGGALKRLFIGSTTLSVIEESDMLTVTVPTETKMNLPEKLLVGVHPNYPLNPEHFHRVLKGLENNVKNIEFFTILKEGETEQTTREHLLKLQTEYKSFEPDMQIYRGDDAASTIRRIFHSRFGCRCIDIKTRPNWVVLLVQDSFQFLCRRDF